MNQETTELLFAIQDIATRIGPAATPEWIRGELERIVNSRNAWTREDETCKFRGANLSVFAGPGGEYVVFHAQREAAWLVFEASKKGGLVQRGMDGDRAGAETYAAELARGGGKQVKTCGTCKFWGNDSQKEAFRSCTRIVHDEHGYHRPDAGDYLEQPEDAEEIAIRDKIRTDLAVVVDGSGYFAALKCREDFGCPLHEEAK